MAFDFSVDGILIPVYDGTNFDEENLNITGAGNVSVTQAGGTWTVSGTGGGGSSTFNVEDDGVNQHDAVGTLNFSTGLTATSGAGDEAVITVNESELTTFVHLTGSIDENITGNKTFDDNVIVAGDFTVSGTTTYLNTENLLVEDNIITLNHTFSGSPTLDAGIEVERGDENRAQLLWDESLDRWVAGISGSFTADDEVIVIRSELEATDANITAVSGALQTQIDSNDVDIASNSNNITLLSGTMDSDFLKLDGSNDPMTGDLNLASGVDIQPAVSGTSDIGAASLPLAELHVDQGFNYNAPTLDDHIANKAYVDAQISSATIEVQEDDVTVTGAASILNFSTGFDLINEGGGKVTITLDAEGEFMDLTNDQTASGIKTFADGIILGSLAEPTTATGTGVAGDFRWADDYLYMCVATNTWKRVAIATF